MTVEIKDNVEEEVLSRKAAQQFAFIDNRPLRTFAEQIAVFPARVLFFYQEQFTCSGNLPTLFSPLTINQIYIQEYSVEYKL